MSKENQDALDEDSVFSPGGTCRLHKNVEAAVHLTWNNQFPEADKLLAAKKDTNPRAALEHAMIMLVRTVINTSNESREAMLDVFKVADGLATQARYGSPMLSDSSDDEADLTESAETDQKTLSEKERKKLDEFKAKKRELDKEKFKKRQKQAVKRGQHVDQSWKLECDVVYADALLVRSILQLTMNCYFKGGVNLRKTWGCYYAMMQLIEQERKAEATAATSFDSDATTATSTTTASQQQHAKIPQELEWNIKFGCGTFYIYLALVPAGLMRLLSAIGFISDRELGEQYLSEVVDSSSIRSPLSALVLLTYYLFLPTGIGKVEETLAKAKHVLDRMCESYPNNTYFWGYLNFYHRKRGETQQAVDAILRATRNAEAAGAVPLLLKYLLGDTYYMDLQWENARTRYKDLLDHLADSGETFAYTGQVILSLAGCHVMNGDDETAFTWVKRVSSMYNQKSKQDSNSPKFAARVIAEPRLLALLPVYVLYINRDLAHMQKDHVAKLEDSMTQLWEKRDLSPPEVRATQQLMLGTMQKGCKNQKEAMRQLEQAVASERHLRHDSLALPYAYYELGELEYREGNLERAKKLFEKGSALKGDDHETLANRYAIAMKQLKREMKEKGLEK